LPSIHVASEPFMSDSPIVEALLAKAKAHSDIMSLG